MARKNKDWKIIRGKGTSDETILAFFKEVGLKQLSPVTVNGANEWSQSGIDIIENTFSISCEIKTKVFTIPQDWIEAKAYILEEEEVNEEQEPTLQEAVKELDDLPNENNSNFRKHLRVLMNYAKESLNPPIAEPEPEITYSIGDDFEDKIGDKWTLNVWGDCIVGLNRKGLGYNGSHKVKTPFKITQEEAERIGITEMTKTN